MRSEIYVEGGGDTKVSRTACRKAFREFLGRAGLTVRFLKVFACGARQHAYRDFCNAFDGAHGEAFTEKIYKAVDTQHAEKNSLSRSMKHATPERDTGEMSMMQASEYFSKNLTCRVRHRYH